MTASAGNHGRALAAAAEDLHVPLVVFTPRMRRRPSSPPSGVTAPTFAPKAATTTCGAAREEVRRRARAPVHLALQRSRTSSPAPAPSRSRSSRTRRTSTRSWSRSAAAASSAAWRQRREGDRAGLPEHRRRSRGVVRVPDEHARRTDRRDHARADARRRPGRQHRSGDDHVRVDPAVSSIGSSRSAKPISSAVIGARRRRASRRGRRRRRCDGGLVGRRAGAGRTPCRRHRVGQQHRPRAPGGASVLDRKSGSRLRSLSPSRTRRYRFGHCSIVAATSDQTTLDRVALKPRGRGSSAASRISRRSTRLLSFAIVAGAPPPADSLRAASLRTSSIAATDRNSAAIVAADS